MRRSFLLLIFLMTAVGVVAQEFSLKTTLDSQLDETSGLIYLDGRLITHNDSGGEASLYEFDENTGKVMRAVQIVNASNVDWEDLAMDEQYIYIGDFGNNSGNRRDLKIYRIFKEDYLSSTEVNAEIIEFSYEDQIDFSAAPQNNNFDAEALIAFEGALYLFTKNWLDNRTHIYQIPKDPGSYVVKRIDEFNSNGLVTGAAYSENAQLVVLSGYIDFEPFIVELSGFSNGKFSNGKVERYQVVPPSSHSVQVEGVTHVEGKKYYLSGERHLLGKPSLYQLQSAALSVGNEDILKNLVYPNPVHEILHFRPELNIERVEIYDAVGQRVYQSNRPNRSISLESLNQGIYIIKMYSQGKSSSIKLVKS